MSNNIGPFDMAFNMPYMPFCPPRFPRAPPWGSNFSQQQPSPFALPSLSPPDIPTQPPSTSLPVLGTENHRRYLDWKKLAHTYPSLFDTPSQHYNRANHAAVLNTIRRRNHHDIGIPAAPQMHPARLDPRLKDLAELNTFFANISQGIITPSGDKCSQRTAGSRPFLNASRPPLPPLILPPTPIASISPQETQKIFSDIDDVTPDENENLITRHHLTKLSSKTNDRNIQVFDNKKLSPEDVVLIEDDEDESSDLFVLDYAEIAGQKLAVLFFDSGEPYFCVNEILEKLLPDVDNSVAKLDKVSKQFNWILPRLATSGQLKLLKSHSIINEADPFCGLIQRSLAEYLVQWCCMHKHSSDNRKIDYSSESVSARIDDGIIVHHQCFGSNEGVFLTDISKDSLDISLDPCVQCLTCNRVLTCQQFVCHSHNVPSNEHHWGFNSNMWYLYLQVKEKQSNFSTKLLLWTKFLEKFCSISDKVAHENVMDFSKKSFYNFVETSSSDGELTDDQLNRADSNLFSSSNYNSESEEIKHELSIDEEDEIPTVEIGDSSLGDEDEVGSGAEDDEVEVCDSVTPAAEVESDSDPTAGREIDDEKKTISETHSAHQVEVKLEIFEVIYCTS